MSRSRPPLAVLTLLAGLSPHFAFAQQQQGSQATPWGIGLGVASTRRPYAGADNKTLAFPVLSFENQYVKVAGLGVDLKLGSAGPVDFSLRAAYALGAGYKSGDAPILNGMGDRKGSLWIGPAARWDAGFAKVSFEVLADALRKSDGLEARLGIEHDFRAGSVMFTPHAAAEFVDRKYVDYYYGVPVAQATPNRPAYDGKSTVNLDAGLRSAFLFDRANSVFLDLGAKALGKGITESPLVDRKVTPGAALGYLHRF